MDLINLLQVTNNSQSKLFGTESATAAGRTTSLVPKKKTGTKFSTDVLQRSWQIIYNVLGRIIILRSAEWCDRFGGRHDYINRICDSYSMSIVTKNPKRTR